VHKSTTTGNLMNQFIHIIFIDIKQFNIDKNVKKFYPQVPIKIILTVLLKNCFNNSHKNIDILFLYKKRPRQNVIILQRITKIFLYFFLLFNSILLLNVTCHVRKVTVYIICLTA